MTCSRTPLTSSYPDDKICCFVIMVFPNEFSFNHYAALFVTQNVGVGTSTPEYPLTVAGTMYGNSWNYQGGTQITSLDVLVVTSNQLTVSTLNITASDESGGVLTALDQDLSIDYLEILNDVSFVNLMKLKLNMHKILECNKLDLIHIYYNNRNKKNLKFLINGDFIINGDDKFRRCLLLSK